MLTPQCCRELGDEQQWRNRTGYRFYVHFKVTSKKEDEIVVEYSSHGHEEQEQNYALSKQVTRSAEERKQFLNVHHLTQEVLRLQTAVETS